MKDKTPLDRAISIIMCERGYTRSEAKAWLANEDADWTRPKDPKPIKWRKGESPGVQQVSSAFIHIVPLPKPEHSS